MLIEKIISHVKKHGGLTLDHKNKPFAPKRGYMVSLLGYESKVSLDDTNAIQERLGRYIDIVNDIRQNTALDVKLGFWIENGELFIDVSQYVDDFELAMYLGKAREQIAVFSFDKKGVIYV
jgi:hypothetical protein